MTQLEYLLCPLRSSANAIMLQQRATVWLKEAPSLQANLLDAFSTLALKVDVFTEEQVRSTLLTQADLPLSNVEAHELARALVAAGGTSVQGVTPLVANLLTGREF
jgi:hypothetical protein